MHLERFLQISSPAGRLLSREEECTDRAGQPFRRRDDEAKDLIDITMKEVKEDNPDSENKWFYRKTIGVVAQKLLRTAPVSLGFLATILALPV